MRKKCIRCRKIWIVSALNKSKNYICPKCEGKNKVLMSLKERFQEKGSSVAKNRDRQRENRKKYRKEERLNSRNAFGISDPTPKKAVDNIRRGKCEI